jgi:hypothetical protein
MHRQRNLIFAVVFMTILAISGITFTIVGFVRELSARQQTIEELEDELATLQVQQTTVWVTTTDVKANNSVVSTDVDTILVPQSAVPENAVTDWDEISGMVYKIGLAQGAILTTDMVQSQLLSDDMRELDVIVGEIPIGLEAGDYVDIRVAFPLGQDYIAMTHKQVLAINDSALKLVVNEQDFYTYESLKTDVSLYTSTKTYAVKYLEAGVQASATDYYPLNLEGIETMILDPNMDTSDYETMLVAREQLELQLLLPGVRFEEGENYSDLVEEGIISEIEWQRVDVADTVTSGREDLLDKFEEAKEYYAELEAEKEEGYY